VVLLACDLPLTPAIMLLSTSKRWLLFGSAIVAIAGCATARSGDEPAASSRVTEESPSTTLSEPVVITKSGSRLHVLAIRRGAVSIPMRVLHDTKLDADCSFAVAEDGRYRCLPTRRLASDDFINGQQFFFDAQCTELGFKLYYSGGALPKRVVAEVQAKGETCGVVQTAMTLGPARAATKTFVKSGDACVESSGWTDATFEATRIPPDQFVAGTFDRVDAGSKLAVGRIRGEDGSVIPHYVFDVARNGMCIGQTSESTTRCVPFSRANATNVFTDDKCSTRGASWTPLSFGPLNDGQCTPKVAVSQETACAPPKFFEVGARVADAKHYFTSAARCFPSSSSAQVYAVGAPIPDETFPVLKTRLSKVGDIDLQDTITESGAVLTTSMLHPRSGGACYPDFASDGKLRCLPNLNAFGDDFSDETCTVPVYWTGLADCTTPKFVRFITSDTLFEVGPKRTGKRYQKFSDGTCTKVGDSESFFELRELTPDFPEVTIEEQACHPTLERCGKVCSKKEECASAEICSEKVCVAKEASDGEKPEKSTNAGTTDVGPHADGGAGDTHPGNGSQTSSPPTKESPPSTSETPSGESKGEATPRTNSGCALTPTSDSQTGLAALFAGILLLVARRRSQGSLDSSVEPLRQML